MSTSQRVRLRDVRQIYQLVARVGEVGDRPEVWRRVALEGLLELLGGNFGLTSDIRIDQTGIPVLIDPIDTGWPTESVQRRFGEYVASGEMAADPGMIGVMQTHRTRRHVTACRRQLADDAAWYRSACVSEARRMGNVDDFLISNVAITARSIHGFMVYRPWNGKPFGLRELRIMRIFRVELTRAIREASTPQPLYGELPALSPRLQQTLQLMLTGLSIKEIANTLQLSPHTINDYRKNLYDRFNVHSRAEFITRFRPLKTPIRLPEEFERQIRLHDAI